jgi:monoamine oxidase
MTVRIISLLSRTLLTHSRPPALSIYTCVTRVELSLVPCHNQLQENEEQISMLEQERQRRIDTQPVVVTGDQMAHLNHGRKPYPLQDWSWKVVEEVVAALRRDLWWNELGNLKKDEKLKILENYMLEEALWCWEEKEVNKVAPE